MRLRHLVALASMLGPVACAAGGHVAALPPPPLPAHVENAQSFIQQERSRLEIILHEPASAARDAEVNGWLDTLIDYGEITRRTFGAPCPSSAPDCEDMWAQLDEAKKSELGELMKQLVRNTCRKYVLRMLDVDVAYDGTKPHGDDTRVVTELREKSNPQGPPIRVDYIVRQTAKGFVLIDFSGERSSLTKNYYAQFRIRMMDPALGYPDIVAKLRQKVASLPP